MLVTSLEEEVLTLAQLYRDRADSENPFDELKNQWGWGGFTRHNHFATAYSKIAGRVGAPEATRMLAAKPSEHQPDCGARSSCSATARSATFATC